MKVLQQPSLCGLGSVNSAFMTLNERKMGGLLGLRYSKADREGSHGLAVENFSVFTLYATFFSE